MDFIFKGPFTGSKQFVVDFLSDKVDLSKIKIKKAIDFGGLWIRPKNETKKRNIKRIKTELLDGDHIEFYAKEDYETFEQLGISEQCELFKTHHFSIWYKPYAVLSQGSRFGDGNTLFKFIQGIKKNVFLVHRLDKDTQGLIFYAYTKKGATGMSKMFAEGSIKKCYKAICHGNMAEKFPLTGMIDKKLDGKKSVTRYEIIKSDEESTLLNLYPETGRFHQLRRHLASIGYPIVGDKTYSKRNETEQMKLVSFSVEFFEPFSKHRIYFELPAQLLPGEFL